MGPWGSVLLVTFWYLCSTLLRAVPVRAKEATLSTRSAGSWEVDTTNNKAQFAGLAHVFVENIPTLSRVSPCCHYRPLFSVHVGISKSQTLRTWPCL